VLAWLIQTDRIERRVHTASLHCVLNVATLLKEPVGSRRDYDLGEIICEPGTTRGKLTLTHTGRGVLVRGEVTAEVELTCSRCLEDFCYTLTFPAEEEFLRTVDDAGSMTHPRPEDSGGFALGSDNTLDIGEFIRQYTLLNLPMKPLCRPDCTGIAKETR